MAEAIMKVKFSFYVSPSSTILVDIGKKLNSSQDREPESFMV